MQQILDKHLKDAQSNHKEGCISGRDIYEIIEAAMEEYKDQALHEVEEDERIYKSVVAKWIDDYKLKAIKTTTDKVISDCGVMAMENLSYKIFYTYELRKRQSVETKESTK